MAMHRPSNNPGRPTHNQKRSKEMLERLVAEIADCGNISEAARRCGITPWLSYYWKARSEDGYSGYTVDMGGTDDEGIPLTAEFHEAWDAALSLSADSLEEEAQRRGVKGYSEPVIHKGIQAFKRDAETNALILDDNGDPIPLTITRYSDRMLELLLKARRPEKFRENIKIEAEVTGGVLALQQGVVSADEWAAKFEGSMVDVTPKDVEAGQKAAKGELSGADRARGLLEQQQRSRAIDQDPQDESEVAEALEQENPYPWTLTGVKPEKTHPTHPDHETWMDKKIRQGKRLPEERVPREEAAKMFPKAGTSRPFVSGELAHSGDTAKAALIEDSIEDADFDPIEDEDFDPIDGPNSNYEDMDPLA